MSKVSEIIQIGEHNVLFETGKIARQATAAITASCDDTLLLTTVVVKKSTGADFFPLTVDYQEKHYAAGLIPGSYFKREGRPSEEEILISRLTDRALRPLFPDEFTDEVHVVITVMSFNPDGPPIEFLAMNSVALAFAISGLPARKILGAAKIGYRDGVFLLNPTYRDLKENPSQLSLMVAGTEDAILMVESEAKELSEEIMLSAILFGHEMIQNFIKRAEAFAKKVNTKQWKWEAHPKPVDVIEKMKSQFTSSVSDAYLIQDKVERQEKLAQIREQVVAAFCDHATAKLPENLSEDMLSSILHDLEKQIVRNRVLSGEPRIDGRSFKTVRPIEVETGYLPRAHGSAVFTRGETQAIVNATLGNDRDAQIIDRLLGDHRDRFLFHYNFPPYCVGETGRMGAPKRREIGHARLARRAVEAVLPTEEEFPYVLRVVSEITESNGSSSMASVCGASLALMDAGVPIKAAVAGVAMGLIKTGDRFVVLTDIMGDEDHLGDMDFKVAGTARGVTALQMDIKVTGLSKEILHTALEQAHQGRLHILGIMNETINTPRAEVSSFAPRILAFNIPPNKIGDVIGKGGATIRSITEETGVSIDIDDQGVVKIFSPDQVAQEKARKRIETIITDIEPGQVYQGKVVRLADFGAFVNILPNKDGLVHISQIRHERVERVSDVLQEGQEVKVKVLEVDRQGRVKLTMRDV